MLSRICQEHQYVYEIHGNNLVENMEKKLLKID
jgi:hypothetical protein